MRFRPANIRMINRRSNLPRLLLALSSKKETNNDNDKNNPTHGQPLTGSLHISGVLQTELRVDIYNRSKLFLAWMVIHRFSRSFRLSCWSEPYPYVINSILQEHQAYAD